MRSAEFLFAAFALNLFFLSVVHAVEATWSNASGSGLYGDAANWDIQQVPDNDESQSFEVVVGPPGPLFFNADRTIDSLAIQPSSHFYLLSNTALRIQDGLLNNDGTIVVNSTPTSSLTRIQFLAPATISGTGEIFLNGTIQEFNSAVLRMANLDHAITHDSGHSIRGSGYIEGSIINHGLIESTTSPNGSTLTLLPSQSVSSVNNHIIRATIGSTLQIAGPLTQNTEGRLIADSGVVALVGATIEGGTLESTQGGYFQQGQLVGTTPPGPALLNGVTNNAEIRIAGDESLEIGALGIINNGRIIVHNGIAGDNSRMAFMESSVLGGDGMVVLDDSIRAILSSPSSETITQAASHTIRGAGIIAAPLVNQGVVEASPQGGDRLSLVYDVTNEGVLRAVAGARLILPEATITQTTGRIVADGGIVELNTSTIIEGGLLETSGNGAFEQAGVVELRDVTNNGKYKFMGGTLNIAGSSGLTNNGALMVGDHGYGFVRLATSSVLGGSGAMILNNPGSRLITSPGATLTNSSTHTIRGIGSIDGDLINEGLVEAVPIPNTRDDSGSLLTVSSETITNNGLIVARENATLRFDSVSFGTSITQNSADGRIVADNGVVEFRESTNIIGGRLETIGTGVIRQHDFVTVDGVRNEGNYHVAANSLSVARESTFTNNGALTLDGDTSSVGFNEGSALDGSGKLILNDSDRPVFFLGGTTHGAMHTIRGTGRVSIDAHPDLEWVNEGLIAASPQPGGATLEIFGDYAVNRSVLQADAGGTLRISIQTLQQDAENGRIVAADNGLVEISSTYIEGGKLESEGSGIIRTVPSVSLDGVTNNATLSGHLAVRSRSETGQLTNNGTIILGNVSQPGRLDFFVDSATLSGNGAIILGAPPALVRGDHISHEFDHTIMGVGTIDAEIVNHGHIAGRSSVQLIEMPGTVSGSGPLENVRIRGTHAPGLGTAIAPLEGVYTMDGELAIEIGGTLPGMEHDQLFSTGIVNLAGELTVSTIDAGNGPYLPALGDTFTIISAVGGVNGEFRSVPVQTENPELYWKVQYEPNSVQLTVVPALEGDFNRNGSVDAADYVVWRKNGGSFEDYNIWQANFGQATGGALDSRDGLNAVPEPAAASLLVAAITGLLTTSTRFSRRRL
jgi:hypothetical protein